MLPTFLRSGALLAILSLFVLAACTDANSSVEADGEGAVLNVAVTIVPQKTFVERIAGDRVAVQVLVEPGADPHTFDPTPRQVAQLTEADAYFMVGEPFEQALLPRVRAVNDRMRIVDVTEAAVEAAQATEQSAVPHEGAIEPVAVGDNKDKEGCEHCDDCANCVDCAGCSGAARQPVVMHTCPHCGDVDTHTWVSPRLVAEQAKHIARTLSELDPEGAAIYEANLADFLAEIAELDSYIHEKLAGLESRTFFVYHAAWAYFAADYGLTQVAIEVGGQEPNVRDLSRIADLAKQLNARTIFIQPQQDARHAQTIANEIGAGVHTIDPLDPDWTANMRRVADALAANLATTE